MLNDTGFGGSMNSASGRPVGTSGDDVGRLHEAFAAPGGRGDNDGSTARARAGLTVGGGGPRATVDLRQVARPYPGVLERTGGHPHIAACGGSVPGPLDPDRQPDADDEPASTPRSRAAIDAVASLDEDRILRSFLALVQATLRTNWFRKADAAGHPVVFKLDPSQVPDLPLPRPRYEIFVCSPRVEGVHLRGGRVSRGGLRWSDRQEDFRTGSGLMKAQMVRTPSS